MCTRIAFLIILLGAAGMYSQNGPAPATNPGKVDSALISLDVAVFDNHGKPVAGLSASDFEVRDNGISQTVRHFTPMEAPYSVLLLLDCRDNLFDRTQLIGEAIPRFISQLRAGDQLEIAVFGSEVHVVQSWSSEKKEPIHFGKTPICESTDLYGALNWSLKETGKVGGRRSVVVFSNGFQSEIARQEITTNGNKVRRVVPPAKDIDFQRVQKNVQDAGVLFYFVAVDTDLNPGTHSSAPVQDLQQLRARLEQLADVSGGRVAFPRESSEIVPLFLKIGRDLGSAYSIAYIPNRLPDSNYHAIDVRVRDHNYNVELSRTGYAADESLPR